MRSPAGAPSSMSCARNLALELHLLSSHRQTRRGASLDMREGAEELWLIHLSAQHDVISSQLW